jgi:hypothetical protein
LPPGEGVVPPEDPSGTTEDAKSPEEHPSSGQGTENKAESAPSASPKKGKSKKGGGQDQGQAVQDCAALEESAVQGQVRYTVEVTAESETDAAAVGDDVNDLVVSSLTESLVADDCKRRKRRLHQQQRGGRRATDNTFLSFASGGSTVEGPCSAPTSTCYQVVSNVNFQVVAGDTGGADAAVIEALKPAFQSVSADQVRFVGADSGDEDQTSNAAAATATDGSGSTQKSSQPGASPTMAAVVVGTLAAAILALVLFVRFDRRRHRRFNNQLDNVDKELNLTNATADESDLVYVCDDESQGYESGGDYHLTSKERRFLGGKKLRIPRRMRTNKSTNPLPEVDAVFAADGDDQSVEMIIEKSTLKSPPSPPNYSRSIITPSRPLRVPNTVDF